MDNGSQLSSPFVLHLLFVCQESYLISLSVSGLSLKLSDKYHFAGSFYWGERGTKLGYFLPGTQYGGSCTSLNDKPLSKLGGMQCSGYHDQLQD